MEKHDYQILREAVDKYLEKKKVALEILSNASQEFFKKKANLENNKSKVLGLNPKGYVLIFGFLFIYLFAIKSCNSPFNNSTIRDFVYSKDSIQNKNEKTFILYEKPDNNSNVLLKFNGSIPINLIEKTKFYYKVTFTKEGNNYSGYIDKKQFAK